MHKDENTTLWDYCLLMEIEIAKKNGSDSVDFTEVDERVLAASKHITEYGSWPTKEGIDDILNGDQPEHAED